MPFGLSASHLFISVFGRAAAFGVSPFIYYRIQKDMVDTEKIQTVLSDATLGEKCDLNRALEMVALLEAQLKDMNPNLDSISEYA